jgi:hypothetical protein
MSLSKLKKEFINIIIIYIIILYILSKLLKLFKEI